jgi:hypothetical protein
MLRANNPFRAHSKYWQDSEEEIGQFGDSFITYK